MPAEYRQGEVVSADDALITIEPQLNPGKQTKGRRYLLVIQDPEPARDFKWPVLLVCPIHSDPTATSSWDVELPFPQKGVPVLEARSWVVIPSLQPVLKSDIKGQHGLIDFSVLGEVYGRLASYTGMDYLTRRD